MQTRQEAEKVKAYFSAVEIPETTPCSRERHKGVQSGTGQTLEESILQVHASWQGSSKPRSGKGKPIPIARWNTPARRTGKALSRMDSGQNGFRNQA